jgi:hypothetical protein
MTLENGENNSEASGSFQDMGELQGYYPRHGMTWKEQVEYESRRECGRKLLKNAKSSLGMVFHPILDLFKRG